MQTKYNVGDTVWWLEDGAEPDVMKGVVAEVIISDATRYKIRYLAGDTTTLLESNICQDEQEAIRRMVDYYRSMVGEYTQRMETWRRLLKDAD